MANPSVEIPAADAAWRALPAHPRLFANAAKWEELRTQVKTDPVAGQLFEIQRLYADSLMSQPPVVFAMDGIRLLMPMRAALGRITTLASVAHLTGERRYADRALVEMRTLAALESWNPSHYLDTAEGAMALAVGYDWLYQDLSAEDRALCEKALLERALRTSFDPNHQHWITHTNNWNQVCHGGMVAAALAIAECDPALARRTVQRALDNIPRVASLYAPDGAYVEGPVYWEYGTTYHVALIEALRSCFGSSFGLDAFPGFMASADFIAQTDTPGGHLFNYADTNETEYGSMPVLFWFARQRAQPGILRREMGLLGSILERARNHQFASDWRFTPFELIWWQAPAGDSAPPVQLPLHWYADGETPIAVHRGSWDDPRATYVGVKGGSPKASHGHMDVGSFVLESDGICWAVDPGQQPYHSIEEAGLALWNYTQTSDRWKIFRIGPDAHNIIRFNGAPQLVDGRSALVNFNPDGDFPHTILDLSSLYADQVLATRRGISLRDARTVVIQDEWTTGGKPVDVAWQWLTRAEVSRRPDGILLQQEGQSLSLRVVVPHRFTINCDDVSKPIHSYDQPNPGLKRIVIRTHTPPNAHDRLVVIAKPGPWSEDQPAPVASLADW